MAGHESALLEEALERAEQERHCLVLNMGKVTRMDSMGLGLLVRHAYRLQSRHGRFGLRKMRPTILVSPNLCVFVRSVLTQHGFQVKTVCSLRDARVLLCSDTVDYILVGPCNFHLK